MTTTDRPIGILGAGSYLPGRVGTSNELARRAGVTTEWIEQHTRILTRRYTAPSEATSGLAARDAAGAIAQAGIDVESTDYLVVATSTPDAPQPPTAAFVQDVLGATNAACFHVNAGCSEFVYGLALAHALRGRPGGHALVIGAHVCSRILNARDRTPAALFGGGARAALGPRPAGRGILAVDLRARGDAHRLIGVPAGGSRKPAMHDIVDAGEHFFRMDGRTVRDFVLECVPRALHALLDQTAQLARGADLRSGLRIGRRPASTRSYFVQVLHARTHRLIYGGSS